jgi:hypothetical protein
MEINPDIECHREAARGIQAADQNPNRVAIGGNSRNVVLGALSIRPNHHAKRRRLEKPQRKTIRSND